MGTLYQSIEILSKEKGIESQIIRDAVKDAMLVAARKHFHTEEDLVADFDESGSIQIYGVRKVVEAVADPLREISLNDARVTNPDAEMDTEVRFPKKTEALGRISAQTFKQVILQKVREAERENIFSEYSGRVGELVTCIVKRVEGQDLVADLGKTEARLPKKEQSKLESFSVGDRIRSVIKSVEKAGKNAGVIISRAAPELVMRLFEQEVPEIYDNTVIIKGCAREAGERTKIAVSSRDRDVDSVGACVGMKGMRVQSIIRELRGEKIDIIEFNDDPVVFATHALSPAKISRVSIVDAIEKHMEVIVDDTQLSLAIGKKGQNVRLAAKLLGWRIDIKSEEEKRQEVESQMAALVVPGAPVSVLVDHGLPEDAAEKLMAAGITTVESLGSMTPEDLAEIEIGPDVVELIQVAVNGYYGQFEGSVEGEPVEGESVEREAEASAAPETETSPETVAGEATLDRATSDAAAPVEATGETPAEESGKSKSESENESGRMENTERSDEGEVRSV
jgi:transcription termination/antitermination protein NusA